MLYLLFWDCYFIKLGVKIYAAHWAQSHTATLPKCKHLLNQDKFKQTIFDNAMLLNYGHHLRHGLLPITPF